MRKPNRAAERYIGSMPEAWHGLRSHSLINVLDLAVQGRLLKEWN
ncbi:hypothetical protein [Paenibacillus sp. SSG-1]|nr:hypothetical protein [Paenibacillus sp. SSG-1]